MGKSSLEQRFATLEARVGKLQEEFRAANGSKSKNWRRAIKKYAGDDDLQAVFAAAMKLREADRKRARQLLRKRGNKG